VTKQRTHLDTPCSQQWRYEIQVTVVAKYLLRM